MINPSLHVSLLEPNGKKATFLRHMARKCRLREIQVIQGRTGSETERLASEGYAVVTTRALAGLEETLTLCAPWVMQGGLFVTFQGADGPAKIEACRPLLRARGLELIKDLAYSIPGKPKERHVLILKRGP
jgi:16S rRNA (guanine527-N7)-methyltransferase